MLIDLDQFMDPLMKEDMGRDAFQCLRLPYSNLPGWTYEDETVVKAARGLWTPAWRLENVACLSLLAPPTFDPANTMYMNYTHPRYTHEFLVARCSEVIANNSGLNPDQTSTLIHASWLHDIATPALGDAVMYIDKANLGEEDHWRDVLEPKHFDYLASQGLDLGQIDDVIHNKGLLGEILDIADRIVYVMEDAYANIGYPDRSELRSKKTPDRFALNGLTKMYQIIKSDLKVGDIYQEIRANSDTGQVYFTDPERLARFLKLRTLLTQQIYLAPYNQARDAIVARLIKPLYNPDNSSSALLTPNKLRTMVDSDLLALLYEHYGFDEHRSGQTNWLTWNFIGMIPGFRKCYDRSEAEEFAELLTGHYNHLQSSSKAVLGIRSIKGFNTAVDYLVHDGSKIAPFKDVDPETTKEIDYIASQVPGHYVYYADFTHSMGDGDKIREALLAAG